jgi:branched-chain amino acid aminotransferase
MGFQFFSKNGEVLPVSDAVVPVESVEFAYGFGVYETIRVKDGKPLYVQDHLQRLQISADILSLEHEYSTVNINAYIRAFITALNVPTFNLKILLIGAQKKEDAQLYLFGSNPYFPEKQWYRDGVSVSVAYFERAFPHAKSLNMLQSYMAYRDAKKQGCYDALLVNHEGNVTEGTRTNFFAIKGSVIYSPPSSEILLGVTRTHVLVVAKSCGFTVQERAIQLGSLSEFDGAFITSTSTKILPLRKIGDIEFESIAPRIADLIRAYDAFLSA